MGYGKRPLGDAGRGKHTGKVGWLGGKHRKAGCLDFAVAIGATFMLATCGPVALVWWWLT